MRNNMITTLAEDYVRMARAKGLSPWRIMLDYSARNAILPNLTGFAMQLGFILGGSILVEYTFSYPGLGYLLLHGHDGPGPTRCSRRSSSSTRWRCSSACSWSRLRHRVARPADARRMSRERWPCPRPHRAAAPSDGPTDRGYRRRRRGVGRAILRNRKATARPGPAGRHLFVAALPRPHRARRSAGAIYAPASWARRPTTCSAPPRSARTCSPSSSGARGSPDHHGRRRPALRPSSRSWSASPRPTSAGWPIGSLSLLTDIFLVIPTLPLLIVLSAYLEASGTVAIIAVLVVTGWAFGARQLRAQGLSLRTRDFLEAARVRGERELLHHPRRDPAQHDLADRGQLPRRGRVHGAPRPGCSSWASGNSNEITWGTMLYWAQQNGALESGNASGRSRPALPSPCSGTASPCSTTPSTRSATRPCAPVEEDGVAEPLLEVRGLCVDYVTDAATSGRSTTST